MNKPHRYRYGRSRIVYIGSTKVGAARVAASAAGKARRLLKEHGVNELRFFVVSSKGRRHVKAWLHLERAILLAFRERYGDVPLGNTHGMSIKWRTELSLFSRQRIDAVIAQYSDPAF